MTTINKITATITNRGLTSIFIVFCLLLPLIQSQEVYAEMKKVTGTSKPVDRLLSVERYHSGTNVRFVNQLLAYNSVDPDWDKAKVFSAYYYINPTGQGDEFRGCFAITHSNGDQTFISYDGSWKWVLPRDGFRWTSEIIGEFTGGSGEFQGIRGILRSKVKGDGQNVIGGEWEVEYEITSTTYGDQCSIPPDKILVVRHAEKKGFTSDSPLSIQGWKRAVALLDAIGNEDLSAIYTTQLIRTKHTALPLSIYKDIQPTEVRKIQIEELCHILCTRHKKETVLVVGHSDTIPELFSSLGITETVDPMYGDLFILTFPPGGVTFKKSHFGE